VDASEPASLTSSGGDRQLSLRGSGFEVGSNTTVCVFNGTGSSRVDAVPAVVVSATLVECSALPLTGGIWTVSVSGTGRSESAHRGTAVTIYGMSRCFAACISWLTRARTDTLQTKYVSVGGGDVVIRGWYPDASATAWPVVVGSVRLLAERVDNTTLRLRVPASLLVPGSVALRVSNSIGANVTYAVEPSLTILGMRHCEEIARLF
jgi:hypothetical protein